MRVAVAAAALALAGLCLASYLQLTARRTDLVSVLTAAGGGVTPAVAGQAIQAVRREDDPERARVAAARGLVAMELAQPAPADHPDDREASLSRLATAGDLARRALAVRPASWQAAMLLGAATYFDRSLRADPLLVRDAQAWDLPLKAARELAPGNPEPSRFLVVAYLDLWPVLSPAKRELAKELLRPALADPDTFTRLIASWLAIADRKELFATMPDEPFAWEALGRIYADRGDWRGYCLAHERDREVLAAQLAARLEEAGTHLARGDFQGARVLYQEVMVRARPGRADLPLFARAVADAPPGPTSVGTAAALRPWLEWTLELCLLDRCPLAPEQVDRLAGMAGPLPPEVEATADAVAGRLADAEILERRAAGRLWHEEWAPYRVAKAQLLTRRGEFGAAAEVLASVPRTWRGRAAFRAARDGLAKAGGATAAPSSRPDAEAAAPAAPGSELWPAHAWIWHGDEATLEILAGRDAAGLALTIAEAPPAGAVVEIDFDGTVLPAREAWTGAALRWPMTVDAGLHRLRFRSLAGGRVRPGSTALTSPVPPAAASASQAPPAAPPPPPRTAPPA